MALTDEQTTTLNRLKRRLDIDVRGAPGHLGFRSLDAYYDGIQRLQQLGLAVPEDLRQFTTIVAWPGTYIDAIEERCDVEGFRLPGEPEADEGLAEVWQANDLDDESQLAHLDSLVFRRSYACAGSDDGDTDMPLVTVESPLQMIHEHSPRTRSVANAARFYVDDSGGQRTRYSTLYTPNSTHWLRRASRGWVEEDRDDHELGVVPVVPLINRGRTHNRYGVPEMLRIIGLTDAAARALTNAQVATEVMALPQRWAAGMSQADFKDPKTKEALTAWEAYFGAVWATENKDAKFGQFQAGDLRNFTAIIEHYAKLVAGTTGLPLRYFGQNADNPPSAEGIRADEARLVKMCERKHRSWGASWERVMRIVRRIQENDTDPKLASMETLWRDPATPTRAQAADAAVKLHQDGIVPKRQTRRDLGYTSVQIKNMENDDLDELEDPQLERVSRRLAGGGGGGAAGGA